MAPRHTLAGPIHGAQDPDRDAPVGQTLVRQGESRASKRTRPSRRSSVAFFAHRRSSRTSGRDRNADA
jgi:hypothetical protein